MNKEDTREFDYEDESIAGNEVICQPYMFEPMASIDHHSEVENIQTTSAIESNCLLDTSW
jgi:hypothetical protein